MREWWSKFRAWVAGRPGIDADLADEVASHIEMEAERLRESGMAPDAARLAARSRFGNATLVAESARETWSFPALEGFLHDVRYGFRAMRRAPGFSLVVILTFALGVGVNAAIFSVVDTVLLKPLPYPASERLVRLKEANAKGSFSITWGNFQYWRNDTHSFEEMAAYQFTDPTLTGHGDPVATRGMTVTAPFFSLLGMRPLMGRLLDASDDRPDAPATIVLTQHFWSTQFGGDPNIVGKNVTLDGNLFEVAGVAAPLWTPWKSDYYLSLGRILGVPTSRGQHGSISGLGRLKPGVTLAAARADVDAIMRHLAESDPGPEADHHSSGQFLTEDTVGDVRLTLLIVMTAAVLILLIACANIASLLLARDSARAAELAVRKAIGAGQFRLVRQLLTENLVLATAGGITGVAFAYWAVSGLLSLAPRGIPRLDEVSIDLRVLLFAIAATLVAGLLAAVAPVLVARKLDLASSLKSGARTIGAGQRQAFRNGLVIAEVALTFMLAFGSGLLLRSLAAAQASDPGFDPQHMLAFWLSLPRKSYRTDAAVNGFYTHLTDDLRALPGVTGAAAVHCPPPAGDCGDWFYSVPGRPTPARDQVPVSLFNMADPGYFHTMRIPILQGREFADTDTATSTNVAVINATLAHKWWPNEPAVGKQIKVGGPYLGGGLVEIVGVAGDLRQYGLDAGTDEEIFRPPSQIPTSDMAVVLRTAGDPARLMPAVRTRVLALDRNLPLKQFGPLEEALGAGLARRRFSTMLLTLFAALAMVLAAVGIYGLLSYWVSAREPEIAIRLALGARPSTILAWASAHALRMAIAGVVIGVGGGWLSARFLEGMVFSVHARNPATMAVAALAVLLVALCAVLLPASRAARVDVAQRLHQG